VRSPATVIERFDRFDDTVDRWWEANLRGRPLIDRVFYSASEAADFSLIWHTAGVASALRHDDIRAAVSVAAALGVESALVNGPIKSVFRRQRPVHDGPRPHDLRQPKTSSFPSGHASAATVAAIMLSRKGAAPLWWSAAAVVATSRIHVRIHHASDVIGGVAVGAVLGLASRRVARALGY